MENFSITILGSGSAIPTAGRNTSSQLVNFYHRYYLIDCGEGTQVQLRKKHIKINKINHIFISHLHGDHFFGLVGLISTFNLFGRKKELHIYSDLRIKEIIDLQLKVSETELQFIIVYHPLNYQEKELLFEDKKLEIYSFPLQHRVPTCGFLFKEKKASLKIKKEMIERYKLSIEQIKKIRNGEDLKINSQQIPNKVLTYEPKPPRSYAYCSDTQYSKNLYGFFQDVDLLYTECTFMQDMQEQAEIKYHLSTADASRIAKESNCKKLLVGHLSARYKDTGQFEKELKALYAESNIVNDLEEYHVRD